ncbi:hypothetical protein M409DRAFT_38214 [Zasmidium cellare ATCC 36951]|uniref:Major facilitator superfamily (MFS) profile domain-containing protein n=1 Tax=Zasmidium cellare ATCC 36951 TaxID=1080233 RepID=A0A6A6BUM9_ZASCE|nr:uncharacterized protein M409DRAFT_38214 [Zasmidium cellare ATCC 36951]KAF2158497.1 hypothetical protein M409DRAFT_38214 [Zasmidium cellare ATCC 36951]
MPKSRPLKLVRHPLAGPSHPLLRQQQRPVTTASLAPAETERPKLSTFQAWIVIIQLCGNSFINSFSAGLLMVCLPVMAADLNLPQNLLTWPNSVSALTSGSCYLVMGSVSDVLGARRMNVPGSFLQSIFIIATGASQNGGELIAFRALGGVANALFTPSARAMLSTNIAHGRLRNFGFASMFLAFPLGAGLGLVLGGIYADEANWRVGYYSSGAVGLCLSLLGLCTLPKDEKPLGTAREALDRLAFEIDWMGVALASSSVALLSVVFAMLSVNADDIRRPVNIVLLAISIALLPAFVLWMHRQEKLGKPAVIPNSLWKDGRFTSICLMIGLSNGAQSGLSLFCSLFFQEVQHLSAFQASLRLLPQAATGALCCIFAGVFINRVSALAAVIVAMVFCSLSPLLMAITQPSWPYWYSAFWAQVVGPLSIDVSFIVGSLVIAEVFSGKSQARGAAVFSTFSQIGVSISLCIMSVISTNIAGDKHTTEALLRGYRASFWTQFAWIAASALIAAVGLRKLGRVGMKRD